MAKNPIEIPIASETKAFAQGIESGVIKPLDDAERALDELGRNQGPEQLERSIDDAAQATQRLEREVDETADAIEREFRAAYASQRRSAQGAAAESSETMREVKAEALANASEVFSSFDGSASSFVDGIQGTFGGLISGLATVNPALLPVAIGAAASIGLIAGAITGAEQDTEEFKAKVAELTAEFIDSGVRGQRSFDGMVSDIRDLATETDDAKLNLTDMAKWADLLGEDYRDVVRAFAAGGDELDRLIEKSERLRKEAADTDPFEQPTQGALDYGYELNKVTEAFTDQQDAIAKATELQELYLDSGVSEIGVKVGLIEAINTAYDDAAGSTADFINAETGVFDTAAYVTAMQAREKALRDYQTTLSTSGLSNEAKSFLNEQGAEAAAAMLAGYQSADGATRAELDRIWTEAGKQNSGTYVSQVGADFAGASLQAPPVQFDADGDARAYRSAIQQYLTRNPLTMRVKTVNRYGEEVG